MQVKLSRANELFAELSVKESEGLFSATSWVNSIIAQEAQRENRIAYERCKKQAEKEEKKP